MYYLGIDVGGSHITLDLVDTQTFELRPQSTLRTALDTHLAPSAVLAEEGVREMLTESDKLTKRP